MAIIDRTVILGHLENNVRRTFLKATNSVTKLRGAFTRETPSNGAFEVYADMGATPWPVKNGGQAGSAAQDGTRHGGPSVGGLHEGSQITILGGNERAMTVYNNDWDIPIGIDMNAIDDDRAGASLEEWARMAGERFEQHKDYLCFNALTAGTGTTYGNAYDNLSFFNANHVDPSGQYTTVQSNTNASALSLDNFETIHVAASSYLDDRGQPTGITPDLLIVSQSLRRTGIQITGNEQAYDTANRELNPYAGGVRLLVAPGNYLGTTEWYLVAGNQSAKPVNLQIRQQPRLVFWDDHTKGNGVRYYKWVARYAPFYGDWRLATKGNS